MKYYLIGIKGSGMAALAELLTDKGHQVEGSDVTKYVYTQNVLDKKQINIRALEDNGYLEADYVIVGHSFMNSIMVEEIKAKGKVFSEYNVFLSKFINRNHLISICGSHGKTTLTAMLHCAYLDESSAIVGDGNGYASEHEKYFFLESCEYKKHFLEYNPSFIIITNIDYDHVDYFKTPKSYEDAFNKFSLKSKNGLINYEDSRKISNSNFKTFGLTKKADFYADDYQIDENGIRGWFCAFGKRINYFEFEQLYGEPLLKDVIATLAFSFLKGDSIKERIRNLHTFKMAKKRFNVMKVDGNVLIDDYAHHPSQILENLKTLEDTFPNYLYVAFYRPDRETRLLFFKEKFKLVLEKFDQTFLVDSEEKEFKQILKSLNSSKVKYLDDFSLLDEIFKIKKVVFIFMSSKNMNVIIDYLTKIKSKEKD